ncbi:ataxin-10-like [Acropora palmata]|uniref:ataxin-10-like n=1 Tax=Acropora palmata TaxID=6131 RepID=UPI003DA0037A
MADERETLSKLASLSRMRRQSEPPRNELKDVFENLKTWALNKQNRNCLLEINFLEAKDLIVMCKDVVCFQEDEKDERNLNLCLKTLTEAFRFLRNCCAETPKNQSFVISSGVAKQAIEVILILLRPVFQEREKGTEVVTDTIRSGLQLLGNTVVKNIDTQEFIWNCCCSQFFLDVLLSRHHSIQDCLCMIIFNCLNQQRRLQLVNNPKIISHIVHLCADKSLLEWGYFILDSLICEGLFPDVYQGMEFDPLARIILLDLFQVKITDALDESSERTERTETPKELYASSLNYLAEQFETHFIDIIQRLQQLDYSSNDVFQVLVVTRLLSLLSTSTGLKSSMTGLQDRASLLETCVDLLRETSKPEAKAVFSNVSSCPQSVDSGRISPSHGFQRDLVRVIGNMCYQHFPNQEKVRELHGIPLLLDHCNVDDHNPYICQWAIFAIRNVLENNKANQDIVASINPLGLADMSRLQQFGVDAVEFDGGRI